MVTPQSMEKIKMASFGMTINLLTGEKLRHMS